MSKYTILRWDAILAQNGLNKIPMMYIKPDISFLEFIKNNEYTVKVQVDDTRSIYDGKLIDGKVSKAAFLPNFFSLTDLYVVTLGCEWFGYPDFLGNVQFYGLKGIDSAS